MFLASIGLLLLSAVANTGNPNSLLISVIVNAAVMLTGFGVALLLVDPLTRRHIEREQRRRWAPSSDSILHAMRSAVQVTVTTSLAPLYQYSFDKQVFREHWPDPNQIYYFDVRANPAAFASLADQMLQRVNTVLDAEQDTHHSEMGKYLEQGPAREVIERSLSTMESAARMYDMVPERDASIHESIVQLRLAAIEYEIMLWTAQGIKRIDTAGRLDAHILGFLPLAARHLAKASLKAYCSLHGLEQPSPAPRTAS